MASGMRVYNASGALVWDSTTVLGGIFMDVRDFGPSETATLTYADYAGSNVAVAPLTPGGRSGFNATADTSLGYPRVQVGTSTASRRIAVMIY